ncbi:Tyrosine/DOPA decarboxylase 5 [Spatholobus suberectus]|nr:Tyrosine/DOPA decarboxylase 5 [Spatholobus suberectus]
MAKIFEELVRQDKRFEIFVPRNLAVVCFRLLPSAVAKIGNGNVENGHLKVQNRDLKAEDVANEINRKLLDSINGSGTVYMTHAIVGGVFVIRCAIGATLTEKTHVIMAWKVVQEHADAILNH